MKGPATTPLSARAPETAAPAGSVDPDGSRSDHFRVRPSPAIRGGALIAGIVLGFLGLPLLLAAVAVEAVNAQVDGPGSPPGYLIAGTLLVLAAVIVPAAAFTGKLSVRADGLLVVRSLPPRARKLRLGELARVEVRPGKDRSPRTARGTRVTLAEGEGRTLTFRPQAWSDAHLVAEAIAAWAAHTGVQVDPRMWHELVSGQETQAGDREAASTPPA